MLPRLPYCGRIPIDPCELYGLLPYINIPTNGYSNQNLSRFPKPRSKPSFFYQRLINLRGIRTGEMPKRPFTELSLIEDLRSFATSKTWEDVYRLSRKENQHQLKTTSFGWVLLSPHYDKNRSRHETSPSQIHGERRKEKRKKERSPKHI